ncbi:MAG: folylpolyglutamate synthase/dihydrofolate synthase family protein [Candidatus Omnitrophota bacterium]
MIYKDVIRYLGSFINYEKIPLWPYKRSLKLKRISGFLNSIGNPQDSLKCIHIAGSKGKGSTCAFIAYILREAGFDAGLYTSPHLSDFRERIRILKPGHVSRTPDSEFEGRIPKIKLTRLLEKFKPAIDRYNKNSQYGPLSFFEIYTALAFLYFKQEKVDFVVLETGLGGRLDATNVVNPLVCAITPISYEHTRQLGRTLAEIASEKAGIIKGSCQLSAISYQPIVISAPQEKEAGDVIKYRCKKVNAKLYYEVSRDIVYERAADGFSVRGILGEYRKLKTRLLGEHQLINAAVAIGVVEALRLYGASISVDSLRKGIYNTSWPGRCEIVSRKPLVVLDGAQNTASSAAIKKTIRENFKYKRLILVLGVSNDKDIKGICRQLCGLADEIILTMADNPRAADAGVIENIIRCQLPAVSGQINKTKNIKEAIELVRQKAKRGDLILITGSLFVVGEAREILYV